MATLALSLPALSNPLAAAPDALIKYRRQVVAQGHRTAVLGRRYALERAYAAFYALASALIPDDAYDWEDERIADFLGEDLNA